MKQTLHFLLCLIVSGMLPQAIFADTPLSVENAIFYRPIGASNIGVGYGTFMNAGSKSITIIGASSPVSETVELHDHIKDGDILRMRKIDEIVVPASSQIELKPGGLHLMLIGVKDTMPLEARYPLTLHLADGSTIVTEFTVTKR